MITSKQALMLNPEYDNEVALKEEMMKLLISIESKQNHIESVDGYNELKETVYAFEPKLYIVDDSQPELTEIELDVLDADLLRLADGAQSIKQIQARRNAFRI